MNSCIVLLTAACGILVAADANQAALKMFAPLPGAMESKQNPITDAKVKLGRMLYYEPRLSKAQATSCNTCHDLSKYGVDNEPVSTGHKGQKGNRNAPTVYNAAAHIAQFWDGRSPDVEDQAKGPVMNPVEMAMPSPEVAIAVLKSMPEYVAAFRQAFPGEAEPVTFDNMGKAIGAFERELATPGRWDNFLKGNKSALTAAEQNGFNKFVAAGCAACHSGAYVGGNSFMKLGVAKEWTADADAGRFAVTKKDNDRGVFKVPSLRNVDKTGPYFHTGSVSTLKEAVALMGEYQGGRTLPPEDIEAISTWLRCLTGDIPAGYVKKPALPRSTAQTPKPDPT